MVFTDFQLSESFTLDYHVGGVTTYGRVHFTQQLLVHDRHVRITIGQSRDYSPPTRRVQFSQSRDSNSIKFN